MHKKNVLPLFALLLGMTGGILRANELYRAFEVGTGYHKAFHSSSLTLYVVTLVSVAAFAAAAFLFADPTPEGYMVIPGRVSPVSGAFIKLSGLTIFAAAMLSIIILDSEVTKSLSFMISIVFAIFAAGSILIRSMKEDKEYALFSLVPVYWSCFWLILTYRDRSSLPIIQSYIFELFAVTFTIIFFQYVCGYDFGSVKVRMSTFLGLVTIYFCVTAFAGPILSRIVYGTAIENGESLLYFVGSTFFAFGWTMRLLNPKIEKKPAEKPEPTPADELADDTAIADTDEAEDGQ